MPDVPPEVAEQVAADLRNVPYSQRPGPAKGEGKGPTIPDVPTGGVWQEQLNGAAPEPQDAPTPPPAAEGPTMDSPWVVERATVEDLLKPIATAQTRQAFLIGAAVGLAALALVVAWQTRRELMRGAEGDDEDPGDDSPR